MKYPRQQGQQALTVLTVDASPPGGAGAGAGHGVTSRPLPTTAHVGTVGAKAAVWTGCQEEMGGWPLQAGSPLSLPCQPGTGRDGPGKAGWGDSLVCPDAAGLPADTPPACWLC